MIKNILKNKNKNLKLTTLGFTLIELLAVIVILAIIAVIATPIIIGIVENARKDAFQRSVELVVSATDININDKVYEEEYTYTITDGVISDNVAVSNTEGMHGSIIYDIEGNVKYAIHNDKWCVVKGSEIVIKDYVEDSCILPGTIFTITYNLNGGTNEENAVTSFTSETETFNLSTPTKEGNTFKGWYATSDFTGDAVTEISKGTFGNKTYYAKWQFEKLSGNLLNSISNAVSNTNDFVTSGNGQLINLGEYGIRYQGTDPNNYVEFNNETWRIIGIVDGKVKLIKATALTDEMKWDDDGPGEYEYGSNTWRSSLLQTYLNGEYYNSLIDKNMIDMSTWFVAGFVDDFDAFKNTNKYSAYVEERSEKSFEYFSEERNIGLMYPSDYGFASKTTDTCTDTTSLYNYVLCKDTNWLAGLNEWLFTPYYDTYSENVCYLHESGRLDTNYFKMSKFVRPVLYLKSNVKITGDGDGSEENKYQLTME